MLKKLLLSTALLASNTLFAQRFLTDMMDTTTSSGKGLYAMFGENDKFRIAGYMQTQFQMTDSNGAKGFEGGDFAANADNRFMLRRGRLRLDYSHYNTKKQPVAFMVFQYDFSERGAFVRDFFGRFYENKFEMFNFTTGIFARPMGFEVNLGSADRESPERGRMSQILMKTERDLGAMITFDPRKKSFPIKWLKADLGIFNGPGLSGTTDYDSHKDFIGRVSLKPLKLNQAGWKLSAATSIYLGGITNQSTKIATVEGTGDNALIKIDSNIYHVGKNASRNYYGADVQLRIPNKKGFTEFRAEFMTGQQTATANSTETPGVYPITSSGLNQTLYTRNFRGGYFYFIQNLGSDKLQLVLKYDFYDPNTKVKGDQITASKGFTAADIRYNTYGAGVNYMLNAHLKALLYYAVVKNEATGIAGYTQDLKDNVLTLRLQYRF